MSPERWKQVQSVFQTLLDHAPGRRDQVLADLCADDSALREEVESLLRSHATQEPARSSLSANIHPETAPGLPVPELAGLLVDHYQILRLLGAGGMGEVYKARDQRIGRDVALKILRLSMPGNEALLRRFEQEIRVVAAFNHPNICHLYDVGFWLGRPFFTMELLEGRTLRDHISGRPLPVREILNFGIQIATALEAAHGKGIVHRDIKPANLFITEDGPLKVMDFGLAKRSASSGSSTGPTASDAQTTPGAAMGTVAYMSPEQARAEEVDVRTDLFSFGVVLYEMAAGVQPFRGSSNAVVFGAILSQSPVPPSQLNQEISGDLERVVMTALEKDREVRFQSAAEMRAALKRVQRAYEAPAAAYAASAGGSSESQVVLEDDSGTTKSLAVLPFQLLHRERDGDEYLGLGLADALIIKLSGMKRLVVRPTSSVFKYAGRQSDLQTAGRELGVTYVIGGLVRRSGDQVRVTVQLVSVRTGAQVWGAQLDETFTSLLSLEDSLARLAAEAVIPRLNAEERELLDKRDTNDPRAYESWLRGRYYWSTYSAQGMAQALVCFMDAIAKDPNYARAYAGVADYYIWAGAWNILPPSESFAAAKEAAAKAIALNSSLAETQTSYAYCLWNHDWDWSEAERGFRRAIQLNDSYAVAHTSLAFLLSAQGKHEQAVAQAQRASTLDPFSPGVVLCVCLTLFNAGELELAADVSRKAYTASDTNVTALLSRAWVASEKELHEEAIAHARHALEIASDNPWAMSTLATVLAAAGETTEARRLCSRLHARAEKLPTSHYDLALIHSALCEDEQALACLERSLREREWWIRFLRVDRRLERLRPQQRFADLVAGLGSKPGVNPSPSGSYTDAVLREDRSPRPAPRLRRRTLAWELLAVAILAGGIGLYQLLSRDSAVPIFRAPQFTKITTSGNATAAAISPDGQYIAYALDEGGRYSLWVRQVSIANGVRILPESAANYRGLTFSRDGSWIYYVLYENNQITRGALYRIPTLGGMPAKVAENVSGAVSLSPNNHREAFLRSDMQTGEDALMVGEVDGSRQIKVASRKHPRHFAYSSAPAWSPNGQSIAAASENTDAQGFYVGLVGIRLKDGTEKILSTRRWQYVEQIAWLPGKRGLLLVGRDQESSFEQIWQVVSPAGEPRRVTNDLNDYYGISLSADSSALVSAQAQTLSSVWKLGPGENSRRVSAGYGRYFDLSVAPGKIVYASDASGNADIWSMDVDGAHQHQLTANAHRNYSPAASPDGRSIAFHSNRTGTWNIWRMNMQGGDLKQLTNDANDSNWPVWTPDGKYLVYHHISSKGYQTIWKVAAEGGAPVQITDHFAMRPAVSPVDGSIACWYTEEAANPKWELAILPPAGGAPLERFPFPATTSVDSTLRWTPDGKGITYTDFRNGVSNVWVQAISGGPPRQISNFNSDRIFSLDWSRNGELIYSRGLRTNDIVLITDAK